MDDENKDDKPRKPAKTRPPADKRKKKREGWSCGFDIRKPENWERLKTLLKSGDDAAVKDLLIYTHPVIADFDSYVTYKITESFPGAGDREISVLYYECVRVVETTFYTSIADAIRIIEEKGYSNLSHLKNAAKKLAGMRLKHEISKCINEFKEAQKLKSIDEKKYKDWLVAKEDILLSQFKSPCPSVETRVEIDDLLNKLSELSKSTIIMRHFSGFKWDEIAEEHGYSVKGIRNKYQENLSHLKELIEE